jgi:flagellar assembly protein FliH
LNKRIINNKYVVLDKTFEIETENTQVDKVGDIKKQEELLKSEIIKKAHKDSEKIIESARNVTYNQKEFNAFDSFIFSFE